MATRLSPEDKYLRSITEATWQSKITDAFGYAGWKWWHDRDSRGNAAGLPDLILWKRGEFMAVELKKEIGIVSAAQWAMLTGWIAAGVECHVWRPSDERAAIDRMMHFGFRGDGCEACLRRSAVNL
jgi:hypothetical protein